METYDFVVIGGGMMGAPCARHLAEAGHSVALVAAPEPAIKADWTGPFASHHDAARITRRVASDPDWSRLACRSLDRYADLEARSGRTIFHEAGAVMAGPGHGPLAKFASDFAAVAGALPDPPALLDVDEARTRLGLALPADSVICHETRQAGWIDPRAMRDAQYDLATAAGTTLHAQGATTRDGGTVTLADGTRIEGAQIIVATGPHAASDGLLPRRPKLRVWARTIAFARLSEAEGARRAAMPSLIWVPHGWDHDLYLLPPVRYPDGHPYLKVGGQTDGPRIGSEAEMREWYHGPGDAKVGDRLLAEMRAVLPDLTTEATHTEPCAVVWTETGHPYIDRADDTVTALVGGNGAAAKSGDEIGRLGALVATGGSLAGEGYATDFHAVWDDEAGHGMPLPG